MKQELSIVQSARLIELGVDARRASNFTSNVMFDANGVECYDHKPIFTFVDVIGLLPPTIYSVEREIDYSLHIVRGNFTSAAYYAHSIYNKGFGPTKYAGELIDTLYELLVWTIQNKHCKL